MQVSSWINAQNSEVIEAVSGENLNEKISNQMQYLFPDFTDGYVFYKGMPQISGKLNYNMLIGEMHFIDANNKILALSNVSDVLMISIGDRKFYHHSDEEFVEELLLDDKLQLLIKRNGNVASHGKKGAFGMSSSTTSITSYSGINNSENNTYSNISVVEDVIITLNNTYYLSVNNKRIQIINQKTFTKQFSKYKTQIEKFVKEQNIRFDNEEDLKTLIKYCNTL